MKNKPVILIVDDQPQDIELLEAHLVPQGYEIVKAASGEEALEKLSSNQIELILMDVLMPGMDGFEVTRRIRQDTAHRLIPIILITALQETEARVKGIEAGCNDFLSKPLDKMELFARVRSLLQVKAYNDLMRDYQIELEAMVTSRTEELRQALENLQQEITQRKREEKRVHHLTFVLHALRNVNQLITHEKDRDKLLSRTCEILTETRGFKSAWIGIPKSEGGLLTAAESGIGEKFNAVLTELERGAWPECYRQAMDTSDVVLIGNPAIQCIKCPLSSNYQDALPLAGALRHGDRTYGVLVTALPSDMADIDEERSLFMELAKDIGFALYNIEIDKEFKWAVAALRDSEAKYRTLFEASADGILVADIETRRFRYVNPAICRFLGYTEPELLTMSVPDIHLEKDIERVMADFEVQLQGSNPLALEIPCRRKDGSVVFADVNAVPITLNGQSCLLGFFRDISERKRSEAEREKLQAQLIQAQKMESIGILAGGIAHDFNNILTTIIGNASLALASVGKDTTLREEIEEIQTAGERAASLTRQLLTFSRKQIIQPKVLNLNEVLTDVKKMIARMIGENIEILMIQEPSLWQVEADPGQIEQIIMNLAVNAKDAMPMGGKLTIETVNVDLDESYFREHGVEKQPDSYVMLAVSDTGIGMDKETQERIFEPFFTTKEIGKGTGLGLPTVYGIVKQNRGFIWVYSEPGQGSTFKVYLPKAKSDGQVDEKKQPLTKELGGSETILIVEDDNSLRKLSRIVLKKRGYTVLEAENGEDALRVSKAHDGSIDLLVTDVVMPKMGGKEVAERLESLYPHMKVLYMSGYTDNAITHQGVLVSGLNFIEKPFKPNGLARKVREMLNTKE